MIKRSTYGFQILLVLLIINFNASAQKEANIWFFGDQASINFNQISTNTYYFNRLSTNEGCSTISDKDGQLLFYTDGRTVWNKQHLKMPHGEDLLGGISATQAALIVPYPDHPTMYYIFTAGDYSNSFNYSLVDINKDNGFGDITSKNNPLLPNGTEKVTAVKHSNNKDYWIITHDWNNNDFVVWRLSSEGLSQPIRSSVGSFIGGSVNNARGYLKVSPDGDLLACAVTSQDNFLEILDFDDDTGLISNSRKITGFDGLGPYGLEFSPNSKCLYVSEVAKGGIISNGIGKLYQIAFPYNSGSISKLGLFLSEVPTCSLQCGPDGKIYISNDPFETVNIINKPNIIGTACDIKINALNVGAECRSGLPNFVQSIFREPFKILIDQKNICFDQKATIKVKSNDLSIDSVFWDFGDTNSVLSESDEIKHVYTSAGLFTVKAKVYHGNNTWLISSDVQVSKSPKINFGRDTTLQYGQTLTLDVQQDECSYLWNDGETNPRRLINRQGLYSVLITNLNGCAASDSIAVFYEQKLTVTLPKDTAICIGQKITLDISLAGATYLWSDGSTTSFLEIDKPGTYWVKMTNYYNTISRIDTIRVSETKFKDIEIQGDTIICSASNVILRIKNPTPGTFYNWYNSSGDLLEKNKGIFKRYVSASNVYFVEPAIGNCVGKKEKISVNIEKIIADIIVSDTVVDVGSQIRLIAKGGIRYVWEANKYLRDRLIADPVITLIDDQIFKVTAFGKYGCVSTKSIFIKVKKSLNVPNAFTPNGDGINDYWNIGNIERYPNNRVLIYNRYGVVVAKYLNYLNNWDGNQNGIPIPVGTYYYKIWFDKSSLSGSLTIIR